MPMNRTRAPRFVTLAAGLALALLAGSCPGPDSRQTRRYRKDQLQRSLQRFETVGLVIGTFPLANKAVLDGDTIRVAGLRSTMRLLGIDTEETFKKETEKRAFENGWESYLRQMKGSSKAPVKMATPVGEEAKHFANRFFAGVRRVRLERDHPRDIRDRYGRYLAYVFAEKGGRWLNYNVEAVRAGMSPYFTKYGYSERFHSEFVAAEKEAKAALRGVWDPKKQHYPDYAERAVWWNARADFVRAFKEEAKGKPHYIELTHWDALRRLQQHEGKEIVILGTVGSIRLGDRGPTRVMLSRRLGSDVPLIFFDKDVFGTSKIARWKGEYVKVTGRVTKYYNRWKKRHELQIVIGLPGQIVGSDQVPDYSRWAPEKPGDESTY